MVKTIHKCEICNWSYNTYEDALECELQETEKPLASVGDVVDYFKEGIEGWDSCDTHLQDLIIMEIKVSQYNPHRLEYVLGWVSDSGKLIHDMHAQVDDNEDFIQFCTLKGK